MQLSQKRQILYLGLVYWQQTMHSPSKEEQKKQNRRKEN